MQGGFGRPGVGCSVLIRSVSGRLGKMSKEYPQKFLKTAGLTLAVQCHLNYF